jgi:hypothetical protein
VQDFLLPIFPQGALSGSVITTVWIGVAVVVFFNLRFGWVLTGLVVPGYLVPLLLIKPWSVAVIFVESAATYFLAWLFSEYVSRTGLWSSLFGRDRFFAIILFSVIVRLVFDGWLLPELGHWLTTDLHLVFDYRNNLHSFGLVIIALMANLYWKTGFLRGLIPLFVTVGVTYFIVRFGLMEFTNFTISNLSYMYEDIAASILASPKAYLILLIVAFIASRMNLLYGWEFSGILIPSLLALQWYQPYKLLTSFVEAFVILLVARWLMQLPLYKNSNIEGARKLLLFFNISFIYKIAVGFLLLQFMPAVKITDNYAFGYLLSTLIAVKIHDKDIAARFTRATLQTSLVGVVVASIVGFSLTLLPLQQMWSESIVSNSASAPEEHSELPLAQRILKDKVLLYRAYENGRMPTALTRELDGFAGALDALKDYMVNADEDKRQLAATLLVRVGYELLEVDGRYLYLREKPPIRGWGLYVLDTKATNRLVVEVPYPLDERGTYEAGAGLFFSTEGLGLAFGGTRGDMNPDGSADVLRNRQSFFQTFHRSLAQTEAVQIRKYNQATRRLLTGERPAPSRSTADTPPSSLWVKRQLPPGLDLVQLKDLLDTVTVEWRGLPTANRQRESSYTGFAELVLNQAAVRRLGARSTRSKRVPELQVSEQRIDGFLSEWILGEKNRIALRGSNTYVAPRFDELLYFDEEVLTPVLNAMKTEYRDGRWSNSGIEQLHAVQGAAHAFNYRLSRYRHRLTRQDYLILSEDDAADPRRYWGTFVFRVGPSNGLMIQVPRPLYEINSFEFAVSLFERIQARALLIAGADPGTNLDGSADLVRTENLRSLFSAVSQIVLRETGDDPMLVVHSRARGYRPDLPQLPADALLSVVGDTEISPTSWPMLSGLTRVLEDDGLTYQMVNGSRATAGYEVDNIPQSLYLPATRNKLFTALWLSPDARMSYRQQDGTRQESLRFRSLGVETIEYDLGSFVAQHRPVLPISAVPDSMRNTVKRYQRNSDVVTLARLREEWPEFRWKRVIDLDSRQSFLVILNQRSEVVLVANLNPRQFDTVVEVDIESARTASIRRFIDTRSALLELRSSL